MTIDDQMIEKYLTGSLSAADSALIEKEFLSDPTLEARILALDPARGVVRDAFDKLNVPDLPIVVPQSNRRWISVAAAACVAAGALGFWMNTSDVPEWHTQVAQYQSLYTAQTIAMIAVDDTTLQGQFSELEQALDIPFGPNTLANIDGLSLLRGQLLGFEGAPLAQIVFSDGNGTPIALCAMARTGNSTTNPTQQELNNMQSIAWGDETHDFILIGDADPAELQKWAAAIQAAT